MTSWFLTLRVIVSDLGPCSGRGLRYLLGRGGRVLSTRQNFC